MEVTLEAFERKSIIQKRIKARRQNTWIETKNVAIIYDNEYESSINVIAYKRIAGLGDVSVNYYSWLRKERKYPLWRQEGGMPTKFVADWLVSGDEASISCAHRDDEPSRSTFSLIKLVTLFITRVRLDNVEGRMKGIQLFLRLLSIFLYSYRTKMDGIVSWYRLKDLLSTKVMIRNKIDKVGGNSFSITSLAINLMNVLSLSFQHILTMKDHTNSKIY